jgi:hypothetical protein
VRVVTGLATPRSTAPAPTPTAAGQPRGYVIGAAHDQDYDDACKEREHVLVAGQRLILPLCIGISDRRLARASGEPLQNRTCRSALALLRQRERSAPTLGSASERLAYAPTRVEDWKVAADNVPLRVEIAPGLRTSWIGHLVRSILTFGAYDYWRLWDVRMIYRPRLVAVNRYGQHFTLFAAPDLHDATAKLERLTRELDELPLDIWCDRYVVPPGFVGGSWRPGQLGHEGLVRRFLARER